MTRVRALVRRLTVQDGYSLVELTTVMVILSTVLTSITGLFVSGTKAELDLRQRVEVQDGAVLTLNRLRKDVHCASYAPAKTATSITLDVSLSCGDEVKWCAIAVPGTTNRYRLYRRVGVGGTCTSSDAAYADFLTTDQVFDYATPSIDSLAKLRVSMQVRHQTMISRYALCDVLVLRNSQRLDVTPVDTVASC